MASMEEIMLTINAKDNASSTAKQVDGSFKSMAAGIQSAMANLNSGLMNLSTGMNNILSSVTNGKTASEIIWGTASKAETNKVLLSMMTETEGAAKSLYETVDKVTDSSLTSMQELIPAMNAFKAATGASDKELESITDEMANFGAAVLAQTGSTELAQTAMMNLSKGIKGAFASLDQYGVSEDALKRTGLWSGKEDDVEGYMAAIQKVIGSTDELMETNQGLDALIGKSFSRAGKKIGNEFLPIIKEVKRGFIDLDNELGGGLAASILIASEGVNILSQSLFTASTMINGVKDIAGAFHDVRDAIKGASNAAETFNNSLNIASNASDIAGLAGVAGAGGNVVKDASKTEKAIDLGIGGLTVADMLKGNSGKEYDKLLDAIKDIEKKKKLIQSSLDATSTINKPIEEVIGLDPKGQLAKLKKGMGQTGNFKEFIENNRKKFNELDKTDVTFTGIIGKKFNSFKDGLNKSFTSIKDFTTEGFGTKLQKSLETGFSGLGDGIRTITGKFHNLKNTLTGLNFGDIKSALTAPFTKLAGSVKEIPGKLKNIGNTLNSGLGKAIDDFSFKDTFKGLKDKLSGLKKAKDVVEPIEEIGEIGGALSAAAPAIESGAVGAEATAVASTGLASAFTSMIVPALAIAAVIMIMIPIVAVIAAEAMVFIKLLGEFMESLHFENINLEGAINGIKQIAEGLTYVGAAMAAMTFSSITTGLAVITTGFIGLTTPLAIAVMALQDAAKKLQGLASVNIDPSVATNIKTINDSLMSISSAMLAFTGVTITTAFSSFIAQVLQFGTVTAALDQAKNEIIQASTKLNEFSSLTPLDDNVAKNIQNVCDSLASVGNAMEALRSMRDSQNWDNTIGGFMEGLFGKGFNIATALEAVKQDIYNAATALQGWNLPEIPEGLGDKITKVSDALSSISDAFKTLRSMRDDGNWDEWMKGLFGGADIQTVLNKIITDIQTAADSIKNININGVDDAKIEGIGKVASALTKVSEIANTLSSMPPMTTFDPNTITTAVTSIQTAANELGKLSSTTFGEGNDPSTILGTINTAITGLRDTLTNLAGGFSAPASNIGSQIVSGVQSGLSPLSSTVQSALSSAINSAAGTATNGGKTLGTNMTNGFKSNLKLADAMKTEMVYVKQAVDNGIAAAKTAAANGSKEIVEAFKSGYNPGSPGDIAKGIAKEMNYTKLAIIDAIVPLKNSAYAASKKIVEGFGNPSLNLSNPFITTDFTMDSLSSLETMSSQVSPSTNNSNQTTIIFNEGAMPIDARNMTSYEAKQWLILALESLGVDLPIRDM